MFTLDSVFRTSTFDPISTILQFKKQKYFSVDQIKQPELLASAAELIASTSVNTIRINRILCIQPDENILSKYEWLLPLPMADSSLNRSLKQQNDD